MKKLILLSALVAAATTTDAKVTLPKIFSDNMVMQQNAKANLWGDANANSTVKITTSWNKKTITAKADGNGKWKTDIDTPTAGGPYSISFNDGEKTELKNILMGELWICSGQSNMEMPMKGFKNQPVENAVEDILHSGDQQMRLFTVKRVSKYAPVDDVVGSWKEATPESVRDFSATAYYFGRELRRMLNVPVGLIVTSWGGSSCEAWMNRDWLKAFPQIELPTSQETIKSPNRTATVLYNGMLKPIIGVTMRGVIWYQGEENVSRSSYYADLFTRMIKGWRDEWQEGDFPFYYCQIAPWATLFTKPRTSLLLTSWLPDISTRIPRFIWALTTSAITRTLARILTAISVACTELVWNINSKHSGKVKEQIKQARWPALFA